MPKHWLLLFGYDIKGKLKLVAYTSRVASHMPSRDHKFVGLNISCRRHPARFAYRPSETSWNMVN